MATVTKKSTLAQKLKLLSACREAIDWVGERSLSEAWAECERADWLLWLCGAMVDKPGWPTRQQLVLAACACAETVLYLVEAGEDRPRKAIETARAWADNKATLAQVRAATYATTTATAAATAAAAAATTAYAADAATYAAYATAAAAAAATTYYAYATDAAAYHGARATQQAKMCSIVREMLTIPEEL